MVIIVHVGLKKKMQSSTNLRTMFSGVSQLFHCFRSISVPLEPNGLLDFISLHMKPIVAWIMQHLKTIHFMLQ